MLPGTQEKPPTGDFEQLLAKYHAKLAEPSTCADNAAPAETGRQHSCGSCGVQRDRRVCQSLLRPVSALLA